jgi:hypothetical protein
MSNCRRSALIHDDAGWHSPVGQRHFVTRRFEVGAYDGQLTVLARGRLVLAALHALAVDERRNRADAAWIGPFS